MERKSVGVDGRSSYDIAHGRPSPFGEVRHHPRIQIGRNIQFPIGINPALCWMKLSRKRTGGTNHLPLTLTVPTRTRLVCEQGGAIGSQGLLMVPTQMPRHGLGKCRSALVRLKAERVTYPAK